MSAQPLALDAFGRPRPPVVGSFGSAGQALREQLDRGSSQETTSPGWSANRNAAVMGAAGERRTARLLDAYAPRALVLHDVGIPIRGIKANVDHAVVCGNRVLLVDSKVWEPGTYWTFNGTHRLGTRAIESPLGKSMAIARDGWSRLAAGHGGSLVDPVTVVWPARSGAAVSVHRLKAPVGRVVAGTALRQVVEQLIGSDRGADPALADAAMSQLARHGR